MLKYEPELGQMFFGNQWGNYELPDYVVCLLQGIFDEISRIHWNIYQKGWGDSEELDFRGVKVRPYYWGDDGIEREKPNFEFENVKIYWYKYFGRGMSCNVEMNAEEWVDWFHRCLNAINSKEEISD